jgi:2-methylcitrate dehydratase PrpD
MSISEALAGNILNTRYTDLSVDNVERAKMRILDAIGCLIGGARAEGCQAMLELVKRWGGSPEAHVLVYGVAAPVHHAAMMNSLMTRSFDFEPVEAEGEKSTGPAHISGTTVPVALTLSENCGASGKEMITALCLGDDLASRLSIASGFDFGLGWDNTGTINKFGAAAITAKLLRLNQKQIYNSFGIVLNQLAGSMAGVWDKTMCFKLPIALAARDGIFAAELAQQGFSGVKDPFTGQYGFFAMYCRKADTSGMAKDLGHRYYADCVIKPYPCCRATHPAIDAALEIVKQPGYNVGNIAEVELNTTQATLGLFVGTPFIAGETPHIDAAFSLRYTVADALLRQEVIPEHFSEEAIRDPRISTLINATVMPGTLSAKGLNKVEITVKMQDGQVYKAGAGIARGDIAHNPLSKEEIIAKFRHNLAFAHSISENNAEKVLDMISNLEEVNDLRQLTALLIQV